MENTVTKSLLFQFFSKKTTILERNLIEEWLNEPENEERYYRYLDEWESLNPQFNPKIEQAMFAYRLQLDFDSVEQKVQTTDKPHPSQSRRVKWWWQAGTAASIMFIILFVFRKELLYKSLNSSIGKSSSFILSDGTKVLLNANSSLIVPRFGFTSQSRVVELKGEANFKVTHTKTNKLFIVRMGHQHEVVVLGTEFVAYTRENRKRVFLSDGKIMLQLPKGKQVCLKPGNLFVTSLNGKYEISTPDKPEQYTAWKDQQFYFDNTKLSEVVQQMKERFDIDIQVRDSMLNERRIGGIYQAEHPDELLQSIAELLLLEVVYHQDYIELCTPKTPKK